MVIASMLFLRAIGGWPIRWLIRVSLPPAIYFWWFSVDTMKAWGAENLAPAQLKLSTVNSALAKLGGTPVTLYEPALWKGLEPSWGWKAAGVTLLLTALFTVVDGPRISKCAGCGEKGRDGDSFCHKCGESLAEIQACTNCGHRVQKDDVHCGRCSASLSQ
jgi:hypothetical protein